MGLDFGYLHEEHACIATPAFYFDVDFFGERINSVKKELSDIPITFSIKSNPYLIEYINENISHLEVCSPGELRLCQKKKIPGAKIIYSGVNKAESDIEEALKYGVDIITAESIHHADMIQEAARSLDIKANTILRLSSGNQFGMSSEDIAYIVGNSDKYSCLKLYGLHYFSGTQKKLSAIEKDILHLKDCIDELNRKFAYKPEFVEIGTGQFVDYYGADRKNSEWDIFLETVSKIKEFAKDINVGLEFGRFLAAGCGIYITKVCDIKSNKDGNYVICDGGIHQLVYHGQNMAMKVPAISVVKGQGSACSEDDTDKMQYCLCGSLCTVADVLVRNVQLPQLEIGDLIVFEDCGAYSVTEGNALFLTRELPQVNIHSNEDGVQCVRRIQQISEMIY